MITLIQFIFNIYIPPTLTGVDSSSSEVSVFSECSHELGEMCKVQRNISLPLLSILKVLSSWREKSGTNNLLDQQHGKLSLAWCTCSTCRYEGDLHRKLIRCWISSVFNAQYTFLFLKVTAIQAKKS